MNDLASDFQDEISHMIGGESSPFQYDGSLSAILAMSCLRLKVLVASGENDPGKLHKLGKSVLGIGWDPSSDSIIIQFNSGISNLVKSLLNMRYPLGVISGICDLLGLCSISSPN